MSRRFLLLFTISLLLVLSESRMRFIPNKREMNAYTGYSHPEIIPRMLKDENNNKNNPNSNKPGPEVVTVRLQGDTDLGYYYVTLFFGTPVQKQTLIVDTGSVTTTIPCIECGNNCGKDHFDKPFDHTKSSTFKELEYMDSYGNWQCTDYSPKCSFRVGYVEGSSYSGHFEKDYVVFGNEIEDYLIKYKDVTGDSNNSTQDQEKELVDQIIQKRRLFMPFGCTDKETKLFYTQEADGILGLGVKTNTRSSPPNILDALHIEDSAASREFSLCLAPTGGYFTLGGHNTEHHLSNHKITYTKYHDESGQYRVKLNKIKIEGDDLGLDVDTLNTGAGAFFDSGTTLTHMPTPTFIAVTESIAKFCAQDRDNCGKTGKAGADLCWNLKSSAFPSEADFFATFPTYTLYFGDQAEGEYDWKPEDYLYLQGGETYCMGISKYDRETILGGTFMKNHDVLFDKANKRLGFIRANCSAVNGGWIPERRYNINFWLLVFLCFAGALIIATVISFLIKFFRRIRYSRMRNQHELPSNKGFELPSHINDESANQNTDTEEDGGATARGGI